jgi:hypothetical protein
MRYLDSPKGLLLTFWLLKVDTTLSAPSLDSKIISAMTLGLSVIMRQLRHTPPIGVIALSISSAVVPGAKFFAMTIYGPASPLIDIALDALAGPMTLNWVFRAGEEAEPLRAEYRRSVRVTCGFFGPR